MIGLSCLLLLVSLYTGDLSLQQHVFSSTDAIQIANNLKKYTGEPSMIPDIVIEDSDEVNSWTDGNSITVTTGLLKYVQSKDELAGILGHEMGHIMLDHMEGTMTDDSRLHEAAADKFGLFLMLRAGYDPCAMHSFWKRMADSEGDSVLTVSHPSAIQRDWELDFPMCEVVK